MPFIFHHLQLVFIYFFLKMSPSVSLSLAEVGYVSVATRISSSLHVTYFNLIPSAFIAKPVKSARSRQYSLWMKVTKFGFVFLFPIVLSFCFVKFICYFYLLLCHFVFSNFYSKAFLFSSIIEVHSYISLFFLSWFLNLNSRTFCKVYISFNFLSFCLCFVFNSFYIFAVLVFPIFVHCFFFHSVFLISFFIPYSLF